MLGRLEPCYSLKSYVAACCPNRVERLCSDFAVASSAGKQETRNRNQKQKWGGFVQKFQKVENRKNGGNRIRKVKKYRFPMWFVKVGPCSFWFRASSYECLLGVDLGVNLGVGRDITNNLM